MCGSSPKPLPLPPPPPVQIPPELAEKKEMLPPSGKFDPISGKYLFRRAGVTKFRIPTSAQQEGAISGGGSPPV